MALSVSTTSVFLGLCLIVLTAGTKHLDVTYDDKGNYEILVNNKTWLTGAPYYFTVNSKTFSTADGSLHLNNVTKTTGFDKIGTFRTVTFNFTASDVNIQAFIRAYNEVEGVVFGQYFPDGASGMSINDRMKISSAFPNFKVPDSGKSDFELGYLAYGGMMVGELKQKLGRFESTTFKCATGIEGGPIVLFDKDGNATLISSFSNFMVGLPYFDPNTAEYGWGFQGELQSVPEGFTYQTSIFYGQGIRNAFDTWGYNVRKFYGKTTELRDSDFTNNYLSYWTDNGAYYVQYYTKDYLIQNMTYEESLIKYKKYADQAGIPFRSMQYSVWYQTEKDSTPDNPTVLFEPYNKSLPDGLDYMREHIRLPITSHNRFWSAKTPYATKNGGKYNFIVEPLQALPQDQQFWMDLFNQMKRWEFSNYMQDWLNMPPERMSATVQDPEVLKTWLLQMGRGASENGITIQYCMALPMHILQSLEIPAVTQARASNDYQPQSDQGPGAQWLIGTSSLFAEAMGIAPFKDTFWTTTNQSGNYYKSSELYPALQVAVATLSTGPVGPGDMVNGTNATLLMRCCSADGLILKPSRPATVIDDQLIQATMGSTSNPLGPAGELWTTHSRIGEFMFGIIFAADIQNSYKLTPKKAFGDETGDDRLMLYKFADTIPVFVHNFSSDNPLEINSTCSKAEFCMFYTTPVIKLKTKEVYLMGEFDKYVPMSPKRFPDVSVTDDNVYVSVTGGSGEKVGFHFTYLDTVGTLGYTYDWVNCILGPAGTATLDINKHKCFV